MRQLGGVVLCMMLAGCATSLMGQAPVQRTAVLPVSPAIAYSQAAQTFARMGGQVHVADPQSRMLSGVVHGAVVLNVTVDSQSKIDVTGTLVPGKMVLGSLTEVDEYMALLREAKP